MSHQSANSKFYGPTYQKFASPTSFNESARSIKHPNRKVTERHHDIYLPSSRGTTVLQDTNSYRRSCLKIARNQGSRTEDERDPCPRNFRGCNKLLATSHGKEGWEGDERAMGTSRWPRRKGSHPQKGSGALEMKGRMDVPRQVQETRKGIHLIQGSLKFLIR